MRIGIDVGPLSGARTGVGAYTFQLLRALLEAGGHDYLGYSAGLRPPDLSGLPGLAGTRHLPLPTRALYKLWAALGRPRVDRLLGGADVCHGTNYFLPPTATARRVITVYDLAFLREPAWCSPKIVGPFSKGVRRFCHKADAVIACSHATRRDIVSLLDVAEEKVHVAHGAVGEGFQPRDRDESLAVLRDRFGMEAPFLLFVGTLEPRKNVTGLIEAFGKVRKDVPHSLVLVGPTGWNAAPILDALSRPELEGRVHRVGYVPRHADLAWFYSAADAFVFPSHYEGFGLPALEAMACGCPVITSNTSSLPEVCGEAARYVAPTNTRELAAALREVALSEKLRQRLSDRGQARARHFTWAACAEKTVEVYESLA